MKRKSLLHTLFIIISLFSFTQLAHSWDMLASHYEGLPIIQDIRFNGSDTIVNGQFVVLDGDMKRIISISDYHKPIHTTGPWRDCWLPQSKVRRGGSGMHTLTCNAERAWLAEPVAWPCVKNPDKWNCEKFTDFAIYRWDKGGEPKRLPELVRVPAAYLSKYAPLLDCATEMDGVLAVTRLVTGDFGNDSFLLLLEASTGKYLPSHRGFRSGDQIADHAGGSIIASNKNNDTLWAANGHTICISDGSASIKSRCASITVAVGDDEYSLRYNLTTEPHKTKATWLHYHLKHYEVTDQRAFIKTWMAEVDVSKHMRTVRDEVMNDEYEQPQVPFITSGLEKLYFGGGGQGHPRPYSEQAVPLESAGEQRYVLGSLLNIRSQPHERSGIVGHASIGRIVEVQFEEDEWAYINGMGYVPNRFLGEKQPTVTALLEAYQKAESLKEQRNWAERAFMLEPGSVEAYQAFVDVLKRQSADWSALSEAEKYHRNGLPPEFNQRRSNFKYGCTTVAPEGNIVP